MSWLVCACGCAAEHPYGEENPTCWQCGAMPELGRDTMANPAWWYAARAEAND